MIKRQLSKVKTKPEKQTGKLKLGMNFDEAVLRLLDDQDRLRELHLDEVRKKVQTGLDQLDRGEGIPGQEAYARMKQKSVEFRKGRK
jgi:hypothetical protein